MLHVSTIKGYHHAWTNKKAVKYFELSFLWKRYFYNNFIHYSCTTVQSPPYTPELYSVNDLLCMCVIMTAYTLQYWKVLDCRTIYLFMPVDDP
jgi:hypothetical protein